MFKLLTKAVAALSLILPASFAAPAWSADTDKHSANCPKAKSHRHGKVAAPAKSASLGAGAVGQARRTPDVQIFSYGP